MGSVFEKGINKAEQMGVVKKLPSDIGSSKGRKFISRTLASTTQSNGNGTLSKTDKGNVPSALVTIANLDPKVKALTANKKLSDNLLGKSSLLGKV